MLMVYLSLCGNLSQKNRRALEITCLMNQSLLMSVWLFSKMKCVLSVPVIGRYAPTMNARQQG